MENQKRTIREWRAYRDMTKKQVAKLAGINPGTYATWEKNPKHMRVAEITKLAIAFHCKPDQIIFFEEEPSFNFGLVSQN